MRERWRDRSTGDVLVLLIAGTVCFVVLIATVGILVEQIVRPDAESDGAAHVGDIVNTLIGVLAGFLAGRTIMGPKDPDV